MLAGGGTAGHVNPLLAVIEALRSAAPHMTYRWVGSERVESRLVPACGVDFQQIDIRFSWRAPTPANWGYYRKHIIPLLLGRPFRQAQAALDEFQPAAVLASGGYVAAPVLWAAQRRGVPFALLQIDSPPGLVNWWFAPQAWRIYAATPEIAEEYSARCARGKLVVTGCPALAPRQTREQFCAQQGIDQQRRLIVAMGGSLGAGAIHRAIRELLQETARDGDPRWAQLALLDIGGEREALAAGLLDADGLPGGPVAFHYVGYLDQAINALCAADFYIGRSGAATVGELSACGVPALLIPDPQHGDRQQYRNAAVLVERGQATVVEQRQVTGAVLLEWLRRAWQAPRFSAPAPAPAETIAADLLSALEAR